MNKYKLTDDDTIKALECCRRNDIKGCRCCPLAKEARCQEILIRRSLDVINELKEINSFLRSDRMEAIYSNVRMAIDEFVGRADGYRKYVSIEDLRDIAKEFQFSNATEKG